MKKLIVLVVSFIFIWSCNSPNNKSILPSEEKDQHAHHQEDSDDVIELNKGEKWVVNDEMKPFVSGGSDLVDNYAAENKTNYEELADQLKEQNNKLIKSCTMDGKSHDELHKWLHPHLELIEELEDASDASQANQIISQIQNSYKEYHQYFN